MASPILAFPTRSLKFAPNSVPAASTPRALPEPASKPAILPATSLRFNGLHLVGSTPPAPAPHLVPTPPRNNLSRARAIVAQVEWEIEQKAARSRSAALSSASTSPVSIPPSAPIPIAPGVFPADTPLVVIRRVLQTFFSLFRLA